MRLGAITFIGLLLGVPAAAQPQGERPAVVQVVVQDATKLSIPNAHVELTSPDGVTLRATTNLRNASSGVLQLMCVLQAMHDDAVSTVLVQ